MMTDKLRAAALLALDALDSNDVLRQLRAALSLRAALAEPAVKESLTVQRPWVGLTAEDINQFETWFDDEEERKGWVDPALIAKYFEAKIKEKNT